jgi:hypothetical protein
MPFCPTCDHFYFSADSQVCPHCEATVRDLWNALSRAEQEVFGDHLSYATVAPIIRAAIAGTVRT